MGYLHYSNAATFEFEDGLLTHLRTVILSKLNVQESLIFTWTDEDSQHSIWLHPSMPLHFEFGSASTPKLDPAVLDELIALSNSPGGLRISIAPGA
ncbi:hypothetical protein SAMN06298212_11043 [Ruaniaceae bacterium KH17]|nr:hypothetical protein SAMN06298212_11043 [Ruaniaceae bacterium KH17]